MTTRRVSARVVVVYWLALLLCWQHPRPAHARDDDPWLGHDKVLHFSVSIALGAGGYAGGALLVKPRWQRALIGGGFALGLGGAKELYDLSGHGDPSWRDLTWDLAGSALGVGFAYLLDLTVERVLARRHARLTLGARSLHTKWPGSTPR